MTADRLESGSTRSESSDGSSGQVIPFRPRTSEHPPRAQADVGVIGTDEPLYHRTEPVEVDDFRQRMLANLAAFVFLAGLTGAGIWLAASISDLRRTQDCVLTSRTNCALIAAPSR